MYRVVILEDIEKSSRKLENIISNRGTVKFVLFNIDKITKQYDYPSLWKIRTCGKYLKMPNNGVYVTIADNDPDGSSLSAQRLCVLLFSRLSHTNSVQQQTVDGPFVESTTALRPRRTSKVSWSSPDSPLVISSWILLPSIPTVARALPSRWLPTDR